MSEEKEISFTGNLASKDATDQSSFEEKIDSAKELLEKLTDPEITLSNSVKIYKEGIKEIEDAQKLLDSAKLNFEELNK